MLREGRDARADGDCADRAEVAFADARDDRLCDLECDRVLGARQQDRELVAPQPKCFAALAQPCGDLREDAVAGRMAELVVDALEVVDVEKTQRDDPITLLRDCKLALEPFVEVTMVPEPRSAGR